MQRICVTAHADAHGAPWLVVARILPFVTTMTTLQEVDEAFRAFVGEPGFPCLAARGTIRQRRYRIGVYGALGAADVADQLAPDLARFAAQPLPASGGFTTLAAVFPDQPPLSEREFERRLRAQLQALHDADDVTVGWDPTVSTDPDDARFSFSFGGRAYFVVGLHQYSSRAARKFRWPTLAFNPQAQFTRLRADGRFGRLRDASRYPTSHRSRWMTGVSGCLRIAASITLTPFM